MKNVQVIDGALNCTYSVFAFTEDEFTEIFPGKGQDIEFVEDVILRIGKKRAGEVLSSVWNRKLPKPSVNGIHGTLFYELAIKKKFYPTKRDDEMITGIET